MRSVSLRLASFLVLLAGALAAHGQINPQTQINWPASCNSSGAVYNSHDNLCFVPSGGPGGGLPTNNPIFTGILSGPVANFTDKVTSRANLNIRQISVLDYGAVQDGQKVNAGCSMASGSTTLTCTSPIFASTDVGKTASVQAAGDTSATGLQQPLVSTIQTVVSATQVRLAAAASQPVSNMGLEWGTDNDYAFRQWMAALPGNTGTIPCASTGKAGYLINTQGNIANALPLASNEVILMQRSCSLFYVGAQISYTTGYQYLFNFQGGNITNVLMDGLHVTGEWLNYASKLGTYQGWGQGTAIGWINDQPGNANIEIRHGIFENLFGIAVKDLNPTDTNIIVENNTIQNNADTGANVNTQLSSVSHNFFLNTSGAIEAAGAGSKHNYNTLKNVHGQTGIAVGGITAGPPYAGSEVIGNVITDDDSTSCAIGVGNGFGNGIIANNTIQSGAGNIGICATFTNTGPGSVPVDSNLFIGNKISGTADYAAGFYISGSNNDTFIGNHVTNAVSAFSMNSATGAVSSGNFWQAHPGGHDISLNNGSTMTANDYVMTGTYEAISGSSFGPASIFTSPSGSRTFLSAPTIASGTLLAPAIASAVSNTGASVTVPGYIYTGDSYAVTFFQGFGSVGGNTRQPAPNCGMFRLVGSGVNNLADSAICADYNLDFSSNLAFYVAPRGDVTFAENAGVRAMLMGMTNNPTAHPGAGDFPTVIANSLYIGAPPAGLLNPNTYPDPGSMEVTGNLKIDGICTGCSTGLTDLNGNPGSVVFNFSPGAGACSYTSPTTTCNFTGSGTGGSGVTDVIAGTQPTWHHLTIATSTTTPTLNFAFDPIPFSALATIGADTLLGNFTGSTAAAAAFVFPNTGTNGCDGPTNALTYSLTVHQIHCNTGVGTVNVVQTNNSANLSQAAINFLTSTANATGLIITPSNPSGGGERHEITGSLAMASLAGFASPRAGDIAVYNGTAWQKFAGNTNASTPYFSESAAGVAAWIAGGNQTWPSAAGIANYAGGSAWGPSYNNGNLIPANFVATNQTVSYATTQTASAADNGKLIVLNCASCSYTLPATPPTTPWAVSVINAAGSTGFIALSGGATWYGGTTVPNVATTAAIRIFANSGTSGDYEGDSQVGLGANVTITTNTTVVPANSCTTETPVAMAGVTTTSAFFYASAQDVRSITGWGSVGGLKIIGRPTAGTINWSVCNDTANPITPGANVTWNVGAH